MTTETASIFNMLKMSTKVTVLESLMHCGKCGSAQWWIRHAAMSNGLGYPACFKCCPPPDGAEVTFRVRAGTWPRSVWEMKGRYEK